MYNLIFLWEFRNFKFKAPFFVRMYGAANIYTLNNCFSLISSDLLKIVLKWLIYEFHIFGLQDEEMQRRSSRSVSLSAKQVVTSLR